MFEREELLNKLKGLEDDYLYLYLYAYGITNLGVYEDIKVKNNKYHYFSYKAYDKAKNILKDWFSIDLDAGEQININNEEFINAAEEYGEINEDYSWNCKEDLLYMLKDGCKPNVKYLPADMFYDTSRIGKNYGTLSDYFLDSMENRQAKLIKWGEMDDEKLQYWRNIITTLARREEMIGFLRDNTPPFFCEGESPGYGVAGTLVSVGNFGIAHWCNLTGSEISQCGPLSESEISDIKKLIEDEQDVLNGDLYDDFDDELYDGFDDVISIIMVQSGCEPEKEYWFYDFSDSVGDYKLFGEIVSFRDSYEEAFKDLCMEITTACESPDIIPWEDFNDSELEYWVGIVENYLAIEKASEKIN